MDLVLDVKILIASYNKEAWLSMYLVDDEFNKCAKLENYINMYIRLFQVPIENDQYIDYPLFDGKYSYRKHKVDIEYKVNVTIGKDSEGWYKYNLLHHTTKPAYIHSDGSQRWYKDGICHRDGDLPAAIDSDGSQGWYKDGKYHREGDLPAIIHASGTQAWYKNGKIHREDDKAAIICVNGDQAWYKDGKYHREGDKAAIICANGSQKWYLDGEFIK